MNGNGVPPHSILRKINGGLSALSTGLGFIAGWIFVLIACFVCFDIVARTGLGFSSQATVELTGFMLAVGMSLGFAYALVDKSHVRMDAVINKLPLNIRAVLHLVSFFFLAVFAWFIAWRCYDTVIESWDFWALSLSRYKIPLIYPQGLWALGAAIFAVFVTTLLLQGVQLAIRGRLTELDSLLGQRTIADEAAETLEALQTHANISNENPK